MPLTVVDPERTSKDWCHRAPTWCEIQPFGRYFEALLAPSEHSPGLFGFRHVFRRVETLSVLSPIGERRHLSLDLNADFFNTNIRRPLDDGTFNCPTSTPPSRTISFADYTPITFGIFSKGILHDFSASNEDDRPLSLVGKNISLLGGLAWLVNSIPEPQLNKLSEAGHLDPLISHLWEVMQYIPRGQELEYVDSPDSIPQSWFPRGDLVGREIVIDNMYHLLGYDNDCPTVFNRRLRLLTTNYFPLLLIPKLKRANPHPVVKIDWVYGRPAEEWWRHKTFLNEMKDLVAQQRHRREYLSRLRNETYSVDVAPSRLPKDDNADEIPRADRIRVGLWNFVRGVLLPHGPWSYDLLLFGDMEGHCEHLNIETPPGVELVGNSFLPRGEWNTRDPLEQVLFDAEGCPPTGSQKPAIEAQTLAKMERRSVSIRRHTSIPFGRVKFRLSLAPALDGVFLPAAVSLGLLAMMYSWLIVYRFFTGVELPGDAGSVLQYMPLLAPLIAGAGSLIVNRETEPLRAMMLSRVTFRVYSALLVGAATLMVYYFAFVVPWHHADQPHAISDQTARAVTWALNSTLDVVFIYIAYCLYFLFHFRLILYRARVKLDDQIGHTRQVAVVDQRPAVFEANPVEVFGTAGAACPMNRITVIWPGETHAKTTVKVEDDGSYRVPTPSGLRSGVITVVEHEVPMVIVGHTQAWLHV